MSGSPTCDTEKNPRKFERGEFITPPHPTGRRSNKHEERSKRRRAEIRIKKDDPNIDQGEKERENNVAHQDRSSSKGHLHRVHLRVEQEPVHHSGHANALMQVHKQQHQVLVSEQPRKTPR